MDGVLRPGGAGSWAGATTSSPGEGGRVLNAQPKPGRKDEARLWEQEQPPPGTSTRVSRWQIGGRLRTDLETAPRPKSHPRGCPGCLGPKRDLTEVEGALGRGFMAWTDHFWPSCRGWWTNRACWGGGCHLRRGRGQVG